MAEGRNPVVSKQGNQVEALKAAEKALRDSEALYQSLVETLPVHVLRKDFDGRFTFANRSFCQWLGHPLEEIIGKTDADFSAPALARKYRADDIRVIESGEQYECVEANENEGEQRFVHVIKGPLLNAEGGTIGVQVVFLDVTESTLTSEALARKTDELERSNRDLEQFAHVVSHDLREPLRTISGYCDLLQKRSFEQLDDDGRELLGQIGSGASRMRELLDGILRYSKAGHGDRPPEPVDCEALVGEVIDALQGILTRDNARIDREPLPTVIGDRNQLFRLFENLISNAVRYHGESPPEVHLSARLKKRDWFFTVRDNGIGIAPEDCGRIFRIFERVNPKDESGSTGIGLAICQRIVESHHGRIWVDSDPGQGSRFHFTLPTA